VMIIALMLVTYIPSISLWLSGLMKYAYINSQP